MEYIMFNSNKDNAPKENSNKDHDGDLNLLLIRDGPTILQKEKYQEMIRQYPSLLSITHQRYEELCLSLIHNLAEYVQDLPETRGGYFSFKGGILEHSLSRTKIGLNLLRSYFIPVDEKNRSKLSTPQTLWAYAVFSAGMLHGIGKICLDMNIKFRRQAHDQDEEWSILSGPMRSLGAKYYRYEFGASFPEPFRNRVSMLLARQLMPKAGFDWLASDKDVFAIWLSLLDDDSLGGRLLGPILWMADDLAINRYFDEANIHSYNTDKSAEKSSFGKLKGSNESKLGRDFIKWIKSSIASGKISLKDGPVRHVSDGVLVTKDAMSIYVKESSYTKNWRSVQTALTGMGIVRVGPLNQIFESYMKRHNKSVISGMVVRNTSMILTDDLKQKNSPTDYVKVTETKVQKAQVIAPDGKFQAKESPLSANHSPGTKK
jgi:Putative helicase